MCFLLLFLKFIILIDQPVHAVILLQEQLVVGTTSCSCNNLELPAVFVTTNNDEVLQVAL